MMGFWNKLLSIFKPQEAHKVVANPIEILLKTDGVVRCGDVFENCQTDELSYVWKIEDSTITTKKVTWFRTIIVFFKWRIWGVFK